MRKKLKGSDLTRAQQALATAAAQIISTDSSLNDIGKPGWQSCYLNIMNNAKEQLDFHARELDKSDPYEGEHLIEAATILNQETHFLAQLAGLNAKPVFEKIFAEDMEKYPDMSQVIFLIFESMLNNRDKATIAQKLKAILQIIRGNSNSRVEAHYYEQLNNDALQKELRALFLPKFKQDLESITEDTKDNVIAFWKEMYGYIRMDDCRDNLTLLSGGCEKEPAASSKKGKLKPDANQEALQQDLRQLYVDIIQAKQQQSPKLDVLLFLLDQVRGKERSQARIAFDAMWNFSEFSEGVIVNTIKPVFEEELSSMPLSDGASGLAFWVNLLETISPRSAHAQAFFPKIFSADRVTVNHLAQESPHNVYAGWAMFIAGDEFDWDKINLPLLLQAIKWGAPVGGDDQISLLQSLKKQIKKEDADGAHKAKYFDILCQILAVVHSDEAGKICYFLSAADLFEQTVSHVTEQNFCDSLVSMLRAGKNKGAYTSQNTGPYAKKILDPLYNDIDSHIEKLVSILGMASQDPDVFAEILGEIWARGKWDQIKAIVIDTLNVDVVFGLHKIEFKRDYQKMKLPQALDAFPLNNEVMSDIITQIFIKAGTSANPFDKLNPNQNRQSNITVLNKIHQRVLTVQATSSGESNSGSDDDDDDPVPVITAMMELQRFIHEKSWVQVLALLKSTVEDLDLDIIRADLAIANYEQSDQHSDISRALDEYEHGKRSRDRFIASKRDSMLARAQAQDAAVAVLAEEQYEELNLPFIKQLKELGGYIGQLSGDGLSSFKESLIEQGAGAYMTVFCDGKPYVFFVLDAGVVESVNLMGGFNKKIIKADGGGIEICDIDSSDTLQTVEEFKKNNSAFLKKPLVTPSVVTDLNYVEVEPVAGAAAALASGPPVTYASVVSPGDPYATSAGARLWAKGQASGRSGGEKPPACNPFG